MCGIAGILAPEGSHVDRENLRKMGVALAHRGPDNLGCFAHDNIGFAHTRLSIVDLTPSGNQPFRNDRYVLTFNGEIYNQSQLRRTLEQEGITPRGTSDTAALFEYCARFGVERALRDARGMFAFAFCDLQTGEVDLCRDRYGIKPLLWKHDCGTTFWASEAKAIDRVSACTVNVTRSLFAAAAGVENSVYLTPFDRVFNVRPGCYLHCAPGQAPIERTYYDLTADVDPHLYRELDRSSRADVLARFDQLLKRSVQSLLMSDAPMGCFVSGGIDSSLVSVLAFEESKPLSLFTANVLGKYSEFGAAKALSEHLRQPLFDAPFSPDMLIEGWAKATSHAEIPIVAHVNSIPFSYVSRLARTHGVKAVLTGEGSDELFLGYPKLLARRWKPWAAMPVTLLQGAYGAVPKLRDYLFPRGGQSVETFLWRFVRQFEREWIDDGARRAYPFLPPQAAEEHYLTIQMFRSSLHSLLHRNDRMGMLASIESRFPFLDEEVVRFALNLPVKYKIGRSWHLGNIKHPFAVDKWIVRKVAQKRLPRELTERPKLGFPLYGHQHLRVRKGFFRGGFLDEAVGVSADVEDYLLSRCSPYYVGKLVSIEVFGRLFAMRESEGCVTERLHKFVTIDAATE